MSWQSLIKPPGKDPKNINEWLGLITEQIRELKQTQNWYDVSSVVMTTSIVDNLESYREDAILSANQGRVLKELIDTLETKVDDLVVGLNGDISDINAKLDENIPKILANIEAISQLTSNLEQLTQKVTENSQSIEEIKSTLEEHATDLSEMESSLNIISDRVNANNNTITEKVNKLETKVDEKVAEINTKITDIYTDTGVLVGGNEILSGLSVSISSSNVITTTTGKVVLNGNVIDVNKQLTITVTPEMLTKDYILLLTLKLDEGNEPILSLVETVSSNEVILAKLSIIDGKITNNSKSEVLQPMNTMIGLAADNEAETIRETIPSGFTTLGELDYDYITNNENVVKLKSESVAYINGYKVVIPKDTMIDIGRAPEKEPREDLLFLEAWKDEDFPKTGKIKWRIRYIEDANFSQYSEGVGVDETTWNKIAWDFYIDPIFPLAGLIKPITLNRDRYMYGKASATNGLNLGEYRSFSNCTDCGLYIGGDGTDNSKNTLKTLDGYCYAIPMFRLYRKPSCGKSIPFEYSKINPTVDYSKFSKMVQDEKVETVHSENIKGRSLVNLVNFNNFSSNYKYDSSNNILTLPGADGSAWTTHKTRIVAKPSTLYTIIINTLDKDVLFDINSCTGDVVNGTIIAKSGMPIGLYKATFTTPATYDILSIKVLDSHAQTSGKRVQLMILEGDWTNKETPEFFEGLKSLGEDDGNLITLKNGVLNDNTYDPCDGNQKLKLQDGITHVISENTIIPEVEAKVKAKSDDEGTDLEGLNTKLESTAEEGLVEFTKIKGRTIQNLIKNTSWIISPDGSSAYMEVDWSLLKPSTKYTYIVYGVSSKIDLTNGYVGKNFTTVSGVNISKPVLITTVADLSTTTGTSSLYLYRKGSETITTNDVYYTRVMIVEGDFTNTELKLLPFVDGIKSIGESECNKTIIKTTTRNLFDLDINSFIPNTTEVVELVDGGIKIIGNWFVYKKFVLKPNTDYTISYTHSGNRNKVAIYNDVINNQIIYVENKNKLTFNTGNNSIISILLYSSGGTSNTSTYTNISLVEGLEPIYEPYKEYKQEIYLKEPLRSLPNGVCDEIVGNKVIRRVGKVILDGSSDELYSDAGEGDTTTGYSMYFNISTKNIKGLSSLMCDKLKVLPYPVAIGSSNTNFITFGNSSVIVLNTLRSNLTTEDISGFKTWLSQNPTTVYYELANPVTEYLEYVYDKESIKTYQLDAPLRSLPNGVKDEIKDGVLIRRCGEIILDGSEGWISATASKVNVLNFSLKDTIHSSSPVICDRFINDSTTASESECIDSTTSYLARINIARSKLATEDLDGFKKWLQSNPTKLIYLLATPTETILTESKPQDANFTLNRQFKDGNWLRELPNGVKDTVENGKVIRRVGKLVLTGSETFYLAKDMTNDTTALFYSQDLKTLAKLNGGENGNVLSNKFKQLPGYEVFYNYCTKTPSFYMSNSNNLYFRISKTSLSSATVDGFKTWLSQNPTTVLYELATTTEEHISTNNYMLYPCHDFNTTCGSMYVGQGRNHVENENKMATEDVVVIDTPFRSIEGKDVVEDCRYKKRSDGYDTEYIGSKTYNLYDFTKTVRAPWDTNMLRMTQILSNGLRIYRFTTGHYPNVVKLFLKKGIYKIYGNKVWSDGVNRNIYVCVYTKDYKGYYINDITYNMTINEDGYYYVGFEHSGTLSNNEYCDFTNIQIRLSGTGSEYVDYSPLSVYYENTEENDIDDLRHQVSLSGFNYSELLEKSFDKLLRGDL